MRRLHLRFRVRTLLVLVAVAALALWAGRMSRLHQLYLSHARFHAEGEDRAMDRALWQTGMIEAYQTIGAEAEDAGEIQRLQGLLTAHRDRAHHHRTLRVKYELAAARPWLRVPPDPPDPHPDVERSTQEEWEWQRNEYPWLPDEPAEGFYPDGDDATAEDAHPEASAGTVSIR